MTHHTVPKDLLFLSVASLSLSSTSTARERFLFVSESYHPLCVEATGLTRDAVIMRLSTLPHSEIYKVGAFVELPGIQLRIGEFLTCVKVINKLKFSSLHGKMEYANRFLSRVT